MSPKAKRNPVFCIKKLKYALKLRLLEEISPFCCSHIQIYDTLFFSYCSILAVGKWAGTSTAQPSQVEFISAKFL